MSFAHFSPWSSWIFRSSRRWWALQRAFPVEGHYCPRRARECEACQARPAWALLSDVLPLRNFIGGWVRICPDLVVHTKCRGRLEIDLCFRAPAFPSAPKGALLFFLPSTREVRQNFALRICMNFRRMKVHRVLILPAHQLFILASAFRRRSNNSSKGRGSVRNIGCIAT